MHNVNHADYLSLRSAPQSYDILSVYGQFPTLGLLDNFVYDIIPTVPSGVGTTTVNASVYDIECTTVPGFHQVDLATKVDESGATVPLWYIFQMDEHTTVEVDVPCGSPFSFISLLILKHTTL